MPTVPTGDIRTYYERRGDGPPVVFVHGAAVDHSQWDPQLEALSDEYTTIGYDVRGHGRTGESRRDTYSIGLFAEDLDAFIDAVGVDTPVLCGLSLGGCIAQTYAVRHPDRIAGLVLADTFSPEVLDWRERLQFLLLKATLFPVRLVGYERVEKLLVWLQELFQEDVSGEYEKIERLREAAPRMATEEFVKVIRALTRFRDADLDLSVISGPTLILYGEHDAGFIRRHALEFTRTIPNATLRAIPEAGHVSNLDNPGEFTTALREFLDRRLAGGDTPSV